MPTRRRGSQWKTSIQSKQRDKYETNEINENVGSWSGLCGGGGDNAGAGDHNNDHDGGPGDRYHNDAGTTTTSAGTIVRYTPDSDYFMFRTEPSAAPVRYYYTHDTTVVDPEGHTVAWSAVRPDMPATVYYAKVGDRMVVRRVVAEAASRLLSSTRKRQLRQRPSRSGRVVFQLETQSARECSRALFCRARRRPLGQDSGRALPTLQNARNSMLISRSGFWSAALLRRF